MLDVPVADINLVNRELGYPNNAYDAFSHNTIVLFLPAFREVLVVIIAHRFDERRVECFKVFVVIAVQKIFDSTNRQFLHLQHGRMEEVLTAFVVQHYRETDVSEQESVVAVTAIFLAIE